MACERDNSLVAMQLKDMGRQEISQGTSGTKVLRDEAQLHRCLERGERVGDGCLGLRASGFYRCRSRPGLPQALVGWSANAWSLTVRNPTLPRAPRARLLDRRNRKRSVPGPVQLSSGTGSPRACALSRSM